MPRLVPGLRAPSAFGIFLSSWPALRSARSLISQAMTAHGRGRRSSPARTMCCCASSSTSRATATRSMATPSLAAAQSLDAAFRQRRAPAAATTEAHLRSREDVPVESLPDPHVAPLEVRNGGQAFQLDTYHLELADFPKIPGLYEQVAIDLVGHECVRLVAQE